MLRLLLLQVMTFKSSSKRYRWWESASTRISLHTTAAICGIVCIQLTLPVDFFQCGIVCRHSICCHNSVCPFICYICKLCKKQINASTFLIVYLFFHYFSFFTPHHCGEIPMEMSSVCIFWWGIRGIRYKLGVKKSQFLPNIWLYLRNSTRYGY